VFLSYKEAKKEGCPIVPERRVRGSAFGERWTFV
jgi:hypothetical protein